MWPNNRLKMALTAEMDVRIVKTKIDAEFIHNIIKFIFFKWMYQ